jgi:Ca2+-transporting ATPase
MLNDARTRSSSRLAAPVLWPRKSRLRGYGVFGEMTEAAVLVVALIPLAGMGAYLHRRTQTSDGRAHLTGRPA